MCGIWFPGRPAFHHRCSAELTGFAWSPPPFVGLGCCWRHGDLAFVCYVSLANNVGIKNIFSGCAAPQQQHRRRRGSAIASETVFLVAWAETRCIVGVSADLRLNPLAVISPVMAGYLLPPSLLGVSIMPRPYKPNTRPPFWSLSTWLRCTCGILTWRRFAGFVRRLRETSLCRPQISGRATCARAHSSGDLQGGSRELVETKD